MEPRTIDSVLSYFEEAAMSKLPVSPSQYLDAAQLLTALVGNLDNEIVDAELSYLKMRALYLEEGKTSTESEVRSKATEVYATFLRLRAKRERVKSFIQLAKKRVELQSWDQI
jgi:hypothetical protein